MGIWPHGSDGTDVNAVDRSPSGRYLVSSDDFGQVNIFNYPVLVARAPRRVCKGHSSHVMNVRFTGDERRAISVGGKDRAIFQWRLVAALEQPDEYRVRAPYAPMDEGDPVYWQPVPQPPQPAPPLTPPLAPPQRDAGVKQYGLFALDNGRLAGVQQRDVAAAADRYVGNGGRGGAPAGPRDLPVPPQQQDRQEGRLVPGAGIVAAVPRPPQRQGAAKPDEQVLREQAVRARGCAQPRCVQTHRFHGTFAGAAAGRGGPGGQRCRAGAPVRHLQPTHHRQGAASAPRAPGRSRRPAARHLWEPSQADTAADPARAGQGGECRHLWPADCQVGSEAPRAGGRCGG